MSLSLDPAFDTHSNDQIHPIQHQHTRSPISEDTIVHHPNFIEEMPMFNLYTAADIHWTVINFAKKNNLSALQGLCFTREIPPLTRNLAIITALGQKHLRIVSELMNDEVEIQTRGRCVIHAAEEGRYDLIQAWLPRRSMISQDFLETAVKKATEKKHPEIVSYLYLDRGTTQREEQPAAPQSCCVVQ